MSGLLYVIIVKEFPVLCIWEVLISTCHSVKTFMRIAVIWTE